MISCKRGSAARSGRTCDPAGMLRSHLRDGAFSSAKAWSHPEVEPRHVAYAIAKHFRDRPEVLDLLPRAKQALEPHGIAHEVPVLTSEAGTLLDSISSFEDALAALKKIAGDDDSAADTDTAVAEEVVEIEPVSVPDSTSVGSAQQAETIDAVLAELDGLVGLDAVKQQVRTVMAVVRANQTRAESGLATVNTGLHLVFTGPPGTGKTTVARLIARLYAASGALPGSQFTEVDRSDLVAGYVGQTAMKTSDVIRRTMPGVLFIDEAYSLAPASGNDFGGEAIATLVKSMEDHRDQLAVIAAGYREEMNEFVESNPGLRSRLKTFIDFPEYSSRELVQIFTNLATSIGLRLGDEALEKAEELFQRARSGGNFGNARFARSLFEEAYARMALRAAEDGEVRTDELMELEPDDLEWQELGLETKSRRIGFAGPEDTGE